MQTHHTPYNPAGCDQQGRRTKEQAAESAWREAAEASGELGTDYSTIPRAEYRALWRGLALAVALVAAAAAIVWNADLVALVRAAGAL